MQETSYAHRQGGGTCPVSAGAKNPIVPPDRIPLRSAAVSRGRANARIAFEARNRAEVSVNSLNVAICEGSEARPGHDLQQRMNMVEVHAEPHGLSKFGIRHSSRARRGIGCDIARDHARPEDPSSPHVTRGVDLDWVAGEGVAYILRVGVAVTAADRVHEIAAQVNRIAVIAVQVEAYGRHDLLANLDLQLFVLGWVVIVCGLATRRQNHESTGGDRDESQSRRNGLETHLNLLFEK
jgi:hypothetical protein